MMVWGVLGCMVVLLVIVVVLVEMCKVLWVEVDLVGGVLVAILVMVAP